MNALLYDNGTHYVVKADSHKGFDVYENNAWYAKRRAQIGYAGSDGLRRAIAKADELRKSILVVGIPAL